MPGQVACACSLLGGNPHNADLTAAGTARRSAEGLATAAVGVRPLQPVGQRGRRPRHPVARPMTNTLRREADVPMAKPPWVSIGAQDSSAGKLRGSTSAAISAGPLKAL